MNPYDPSEYLCDLADYVNNKLEYLPFLFLNDYHDDFPELNRNILLKLTSTAQHQS